MRARDLMTSPVFTCSEHETLARAAQIMWEKDCGCLPVIDQASRLVGMITDRDICMAAYTQGRPLDASTVGSVAARKIASCSPDDSLGTVEEQMRSWQVRRVPVTEHGRLVGIVTLGDLARSTQAGTLRATLSVPGVLKTVASIYEKRPSQAAAE